MVFIDLPDEYVHADKTLFELFYPNKSNIPFDSAMSLTSQVISMNEGHYSAWSWRRHVLFVQYTTLKENTASSLLENELQWIRCFIKDGHSKCYQVWHHRQCIVDKMLSTRACASLLSLVEDEIWDICEQMEAWVRQFLKEVSSDDLVESWSSMLDKLEPDESLIDPKNYHAWQYLGWLTDQNDQAKMQLRKRCKQLLAIDPLNNSALCMLSRG